MTTLDSEITFLKDRQRKLQEILRLQTEIRGLECQVFRAKKADAKAIRTIAATVCDFYQVPECLLSEEGRPEWLVVPRHVVCYLWHTLAGIGWSTMGRVLNRDHASAMHGYRRTIQRAETDRHFAADLETLKKKCMERLN